MGVTIRKKAGDYYVVITDKTLFPARKSHRKTKKVGPDKRTAERVAEEIRARIVLGKQPFREASPSRPTLGHLAERYFEIHGRNLAFSTLEKYRSVWKNHISARWGRVPIDEIARPDIEDWLRPLLDTHSPRSVQRIQSALSGILGYAVHLRLLPENPATNLGRYLYGDRDRPATATPDPYTAGDLRIYLDTTRERFPRDYPFSLLLAHAGLRVGEAVGIQWGDIQWTDGYMLIRRAVVRGRPKGTKTGRNRHVRMTAELADELSDHRSRMKRLAIRRGWGDMPQTVFCTATGAYYDPSNWSARIHRKVIASAGLRYIRPYDLRHTWITLRLAAGHPIEEVSKEAGHSSIRITADVYAHWLPGRSGSDLDAVFGDPIHRSRRKA